MRRRLLPPGGGAPSQSTRSTASLVLRGRRWLPGDSHIARAQDERSTKGGAWGSPTSRCALPVQRAREPRRRTLWRLADAGSSLSRGRRRCQSPGGSPHRARPGTSRLLHREGEATDGAAGRHREWIGQPQSHIRCRGGRGSLVESCRRKWTPGPPLLQLRRRREDTSRLPRLGHHESRHRLPGWRRAAPQCHRVPHERSWGNL
mmetsp:Transcript_90803/g.261649  ORF Transcript_90803/g.261649 Transcript_90803/m.261649 type:complete len:204 (-) Transcript_90803:225-836(-)